MIFKETKLAGAFIIEVQRLEDDRGFLGRSFCRHEFAGQGLNPEVAQCNISFNRDAGTLRGMHYQAAPHAEEKLVRCTRGGLYDVIVDLRRESPTFKQWIALELTEDNCRMLYIPKAFRLWWTILIFSTRCPSFIIPNRPAASAGMIRSLGFNGPWGVG